MSDRRVLLYFAWSRPAETGAPLAVIDDRVPAVFELRRLFYPKFESLSGRDDVDRGIAGFLDHILKPTFTAFVEHAEALACNDVIQVERVCELARLFNPFRRRTLTPLAVLDALDPAPESGPELGSRLDAERGQTAEPKHNQFNATIKVSFVMHGIMVVACHRLTPRGSSGAQTPQAASRREGGIYADFEQRRPICQTPFVGNSGGERTWHASTTRWCS